MLFEQLRLDGGQRIQTMPNDTIASIERKFLLARNGGIVQTRNVFGLISENGKLNAVSNDFRAARIVQFVGND